MKYDVVALGELLIDFTYYGQSENGRTLFEQNPGGAPANVLAAVSKLGGKTAFIGKVGADMHGELLRGALAQAGIETRGLISDPDVFTTLAFVSLQDGERSFSFARKPGADTRLQETELDETLLKRTRVFHCGSLSLTDEPARSATLAALKLAREAGALIAYDPNYRPPLWPDEATAAARMQSIFPLADLVKCSEDEIQLLTDFSDPDAAAAHILAQGAACVVITLGSEGAFLKTSNFSLTVPGFAGRVVDTTGAGDSFWGGFLYQLTRRRAPLVELTPELAEAAVRFANATASLCIEKRGAIEAMPGLDEVLSRLNN